MRDRVPAGDERVRHRGERVGVVERPMAGRDGVEAVEHARLSPGVRLLVVDGDEVLLLPDGPQGPGAPTWALPGGPAFDSLAAYESALYGDGSVESMADDAAPVHLRETVGLDPVAPERRFVLPAGPGVEFDLYCYVVERTRPAPREGDPSDATWLDRAEARAAALDGRIPEGRAALALLRWLDEEDDEADGDEDGTGD